jgi:hypothetical protein
MKRVLLSLVGCGLIFLMGIPLNSCRINPGRVLSEETINLAGLDQSRPLLPVLSDLTDYPINTDGVYYSSPLFLDASLKVYAVVTSNSPLSDSNHQIGIYHNDILDGTITVAPLFLDFNNNNISWIDPIHPILSSKGNILKMDLWFTTQSAGYYQICLINNSRNPVSANYKVYLG